MPSQDENRNTDERPYDDENPEQILDAVDIEPQEPTADQQIEQLQADLEAAKDAQLRTAAQLQNFRRRTQEEQQQRMLYACEGLLSDLVFVIDHFEMACEASDINEHTQAVSKGYEMILQQLIDVAMRHGLQPIDAAPGMFFDPEYHEALERVVTTDPCEGTVTRIIRKGYKLHDRVLRPVQVAVAVAPEQPEA